MHYKLLNALCRTQYNEDREKAAQLHRDLNASGMLNLLTVSTPFPLKRNMNFSPI